MFGVRDLSFSERVYSAEGVMSSLIASYINATLETMIVGFYCSPSRRDM